MDLVIADIRKRQKNWWGMIALALGLLLTATLLWTQVKDTRENTERLNRNAHALNQEIKELKKEYIVFEDPQVKALCVQHWDTDGDGELSYQEAAAVEHLGNTFTQDLLINTFDELEYFTGLTEIDVDAFNGCANLQSVKIPPTVLRLRQNAFRGTGLRSIVIPSRTVTFGDHVLEDCPLPRGSWRQPDCIAVLDELDAFFHIQRSQLIAQVINYGHLLLGCSLRHLTSC